MAKKRLLVGLLCLVILSACSHLKCFPNGTKNLFPTSVQSKYP